jgi:hypothetical protein
LRVLELAAGGAADTAVGERGETPPRHEDTKAEYPQTGWAGNTELRLVPAFCMGGPADGEIGQDSQDEE